MTRVSVLRGEARDGAVLLDGASAWLDCSTEAEYPAGDHDIVVLRVHDLDADHGIKPIGIHASKFRQLENTQRRRRATEPERRAITYRLYAHDRASSERAN